MIDLHSHLLPGVDDGSKSVVRSLRVLAAFREQGITGVCLTPHLKIGDLGPRRLEERLARLDEAFVVLAEQAGQGPRLSRGVELMLDAPLASDLELDRRISLGGSRYVLVEFPRMVIAHAIHTLLQQVIDRGFVPVVAHPERYAASAVDEVRRWRELGAVIQVDATTMVRHRGNAGERARAILESGLADIVAADNHGDSRSLAVVGPELEKCDATVQADLLVRQNPAAILDDRVLAPVAPVRFRRGWADRLRGFLGGEG